MKEKGIAVIGRVAKDVELLDGQTVKTRVLYEELCNRFPGHSVITVDTYRYGKRFPVILVNLIRAFLHSKHIFVLLSRNGRTYLFPVITGLNRLFRRHLYHDVIGGALPKEAAASPSLRKQLGRFEVNWVETVQMKEALQEVGVTNVEILHNFKRLPILIPNQLSLEREEPYIFTMFSRVVREKGMDHASKAVAEVNRRAGRTRALLRIYGPIDPSYEVEFIALLKQYEGVVTYEGCVPYKESVEALSRSFVLLFPSTYPGEGMPGTILDAFAAGVPVIATDWHFNGELVHNGITGYCYDWHNMEQLTEWVAYAVEHPEEIDQMRENCLQAAHLYSADAAMEQICRRMGEEGEL